MYVLCVLSVVYMLFVCGLMLYCLVNVNVCDSVVGSLVCVSCVLVVFIR